MQQIDLLSYISLTKINSMILIKKKYQNIFADIAKIKSNLTIFIKSDDDDIKNIVETALNKEGIKILNEEKGNVLTIKTKKFNNEIYGSYSLNLNISFNLINIKSEKIASNNLSISAISAISFDRASYNASLDLQEKIKNDSIFIILGIK